MWEASTRVDEAVSMCVCGWRLCRILPSLLFSRRTSEVHDGSSMSFQGIFTGVGPSHVHVDSVTHTDALMARLFPTIDAKSPTASASSPFRSSKTPGGDLAAVQNLLPHETHVKASQTLEVLCWSVHDALVRQLTVSLQKTSSDVCMNGLQPAGRLSAWETAGAFV